jgi:hypothetical protein
VEMDDGGRCVVQFMCSVMQASATVFMCICSRYAILCSTMKKHKS